MNAQTLIPVRIVSNALEVISSGTFLTADSNKAEIFLCNLCFELRFSNTDGIARMKAEDGEKGKRIVFNLENFNNPLGAGNTIPLEVGELNNRKLYFSFYINAYDSDSIKRVTYTFYLGENCNEQ